MKKLTDDQEKMQLVSKLVKEGNIDLAEALKLLEVEVEKEFVYIPNTITIQPYLQPITFPNCPPSYPYPATPWYDVNKPFYGDHLSLPLPATYGGTVSKLQELNGTITVSANGSISVGNCANTDVVSYEAIKNVPCTFTATSCMN